VPNVQEILIVEATTAKTKYVSRYRSLANNANLVRYVQKVLAVLIGLMGGVSQLRKWEKNANSLFLAIIIVMKGCCATREFVSVLNR
jgi:hypothetical protein